MGHLEQLPKYVIMIVLIKSVINFYLDQNNP